MAEIAGNAKLIRDKKITGTMTDGKAPVYDAGQDEFVLTEVIASSVKITVSDTAPSNPSENDLWVDIS